MSEYTINEYPMKGWTHLVVVHPDVPSGLATYALDNSIKGTAAEKQVRQDLINQSKKILAEGQVCDNCGAALVNEDCPNYGFGVEHESVTAGNGEEES